MRKQWIPGALLRFFKRLGTRLGEGACPVVRVAVSNEDFIFGKTLNVEAQCLLISDELFQWFIQV